MQTLTKLDLQGNEIGVEGAQSFAQVLATNKVKQYDLFFY